MINENPVSPPPGIKAIVRKASDINQDHEERASYIEISDLNGLRSLLMHVEIPVIMFFAPEQAAPAELVMVLYDDPIEGFD